MGGTGAETQASRDVHDAWRLAYVVVADEALATKAVARAFVDTAPRLEFLAATLRISLTRAAERVDRESASSVTTALWQLRPEQRGALWLATVNDLDDPSLGAVLGLTATNAGHVARRAAEWLDVALDHESGPLCPDEPRLADFLNGRLPDDEAVEMREHVPGCPTCQTKARVFDELADLKSVLVAAVPEPPEALTVESLRRPGREPSADGAPTLADGWPRTPAVRPLAASCAALLVLGLIGLAVVHPARHGADPARPSGVSAVVPGLPTTSATGGVVTSTASLPARSAATVAPTTTGIPAVTFPTVPAGGRRP
jgi:hypothetical protein